MPDAVRMARSLVLLPSSDPFSLVLFITVSISPVDVNKRPGVRLAAAAERIKLGRGPQQSSVKPSVLGPRHQGIDDMADLWREVSRPRPDCVKFNLRRRVFREHSDQRP